MSSLLLIFQKRSKRNEENNFYTFLSNLLFSQTVILDTNQILIGDQTNLTLSNPISENFIWPEIDTILLKKILKS